MISIIVPVYNVKAYLEKCINSLMNQTLSGLEVIVVDDGSTDGSRELVDRLCANDKRFRIFYKENGGLMSAWIHGVQQALGDYIGFVDSDDYPDLKMFELMYTQAVEKNADIVYCDYYAIEGDECTPVKTTKGLVHEEYFGTDKMSEVRKLVFPGLGAGCISNARWNKIFRKELFMQNIKYCESLSRTFEDRYIVPACIFSAKSFLYIKQPLYYYLHRDFSNCGKPSKELLVDIKRMSESQKLMLEDKGLFDEYQYYWECAKIDSVRLFIRRNILGYGSFKLATLSSMKLIWNKEYSALLQKHRSSLMQSGKLDRLISCATTLKCPFILLIGRVLFKARMKGY